MLSTHLIHHRGCDVPIILDWEFAWICKGHSLILDHTNIIPEVSFK